MPLDFWFLWQAAILWTHLVKQLWKASTKHHFLAYQIISPSRNPSSALPHFWPKIIRCTTMNTKPLDICSCDKNPKVLTRHYRCSTSSQSRLIPIDWLYSMQDGWQRLTIVLFKFLNFPLQTPHCILNHAALIWRNININGLKSSVSRCSSLTNTLITTKTRSVSSKTEPI